MEHSRRGFFRRLLTAPAVAAGAAVAAKAVAAAPVALPTIPVTKPIWVAERLGDINLMTAGFSMSSEELRRLGADLVTVSNESTPSLIAELPEDDEADGAADWDEDRDESYDE